MTTDKKTESTPPTPLKPATATEGNGLAIASLVLGVVSYSGFFLFTGIPAIITGAMALKRGQKERAMSIAGIILGSIATALSLLFILLLIVMVVIGTNVNDMPQINESQFDDSSMPAASTRT